MDSRNKHILTILNAKCEYVCAANKIAKKLEYGEDVSCCVNKLYLASRIIDRLECYNFSNIELGEENIDTVFKYSVNYVSVIPSGVFSALIVNGDYVSSYITDGSETEADVSEYVLTSAGIKYSTVISGLNKEFTVTMPCNTVSLKSKRVLADKTTTYYDVPVFTEGVCSVNPYPNCISFSDLPKMYEVLNKLLS